MTYFIWLLRIVHIVAGAFWFGGVIMMTFFVGPTVREMGEAGPKFVALLVRNRKFTTRMSIAAGLTALAGGILYWIDSIGSHILLDDVRRGHGVRDRRLLRHHRFCSRHFDRSADDKRAGESRRADPGETDTRTTSPTPIAPEATDDLFDDRIRHPAAFVDFHVDRQVFRFLIFSENGS